MTDAEARILAARAQRGDVEARDHLVEAHMRLADLVAQEWSRSFPGGAKDYATGWDDLKQECAMAMVTGIGKYDTLGKVPFRSYMRHCMRTRSWELLKVRLRRRMVSEQAKALGVLVPDEQPSPLDQLIDKQRTAWAHRLLHHYCSAGHITERQFEVLHLRAQGYTFPEIAEELCVHRVTAVNDSTAARKALANEDS